MALTTYPVSPEEVVRNSSQLWSEIVGIASAGELIPTIDWAYEFSGGRKSVVHLTDAKLDNRHPVAPLASSNLRPPENS